MTFLRFFLFFSVIASSSAVGAQYDHPPQLFYDRLVYTENSVMPFKQNGKWGFVDASDKVMIPAQYDSLWNEDRIRGLPHETGRTLRCTTCSCVRFLTGRSLTCGTGARCRRVIIQVIS